MKNSNEKVTVYSGTGKCLGLVSVKLQIGLIIKNITINVIANTNYESELLLGLDYINEYNLSLDKTYNVFQELHGKVMQIKNNYTQKSYFTINSIEIKNEIESNVFKNENLNESEKINY